MDILKRPRRLRENSTLREMIKEVEVKIDDLIYPLFVIEGKNIKNEIFSMPGVFQFSIDMLKEEIEDIEQLGIKGIMLFGIPSKKDKKGSNAYDDDNGIIQKAIKYIKNISPDILLIADVCLCEYTDHGHCGLIKNNIIDNDSTVNLLAKTAISYAKAGVDVVAPSDMMDNRIKEIRMALEEEGFKNTLIMSYSVKYASSFYGPFRDAAQSTPKFGDRKTYQMDYRNRKEAIREVLLDIEEGADFIIVKPALAYLDIISKINEIINIPLVAYNVSGEYAMIKAASEKGWINEENIMIESLTAIKRAGANLIITYFAKDFARLI